MKKQLSPELKAMLAASEKKRKATRPIVRSYWIGKPDYSAKKLFAPKEHRSSAVAADSCGVSGLKPVWHGRAS